MTPWRSLGRVAPADSPRKTRQGQYDHAKRAHAAPPFPFSASLRTPSGSPQRNAQARSELTKPDNCTAFENVLTAIPTYGGIETQHSASCFSFPDEGKETGVIERRTFQQERMAGVRGAQNATCRETPPSPTATPPFQGRQPTLPQQSRRAPQTSPPRAQSPLPELQPAKRNVSPAHNSLSYEAEQRIAAPARNNARPHDFRSSIPLSELRIAPPLLADHALIIAARAAPFNALFSKY